MARTNSARIEENVLQHRAFGTAPTHPWMSTPQAADYIGSKAKTLEHWRHIGGGPRFTKAGRRVVYRADWLDEWLESRAVTSTAESKRLGMI